MSAPGTAGATRRPWLRAVAIIACVLVASAHVGSPHIYLEENAGPYPVIVVVHMPPAIPGEAELQVRLQDRRPDEEVEVQVREVPPEGEALAPEWSAAARSSVDPDFFTAPVPLMVFGLWQAQVRVSGPRGEGVLSIPIPARVASPGTMSVGFSAVLAVLLALLVASVWQLFAALGRDGSRISTGEPSPADVRAGRRWGSVAVVALLAWLGFLGSFWHRAAASREALGGSRLTSELAVTNGPPVAGTPVSLRLDVRDRDGRPPDDLAPDHGKMLHLIGVSLPTASYFLHIHPEMTAPGTFSFEFTPPGPGTYKFFGDLLHETGEGETVTNLLEVEPDREGGDEPAGQTGTAAAVELADPDDSRSLQPPIGETPVGNRSWEVGDGLVMRWVEPDAGRLEQGEFIRLGFELAHADGRPVAEIEPYMGMAGHMLVMRDDAEVFAHVHPRGSIPGWMASETAGGMAADMSGMPSATSRATFPFGFAEKGLYRAWVQMRYMGTVFTGVFDFLVE